MTTPTNNFPFEFEFPTQKGQKVIHSLKRKKGEYISTPIEQRLKELEAPTNTKWKKVITKWKNDIKTGKREKPKRSKRVKFTMVKIRNIWIDDDSQRDPDYDWIASLANPKSFAVEFMSPIQCIYDPTLKKFIAINSQHTVILETALAYHGLWDGFDGDVLDLEVPVVYVESESRALMRMGFRILNGENQKAIEPYVDHKILVLSKRIDETNEEKPMKAAIIQQINEDEGYEPIASTDISMQKEPWAISCISEMMKHYSRPERWRFVLRTHKKYFGNIKLEVMECDLYGYMYDYFTDLETDVYGEEFEDEFLTPAMSIIQEFFTVPSTFGNDSAHVQIRWRAKKDGRTIDDKESKKIDPIGSFIYLLKLYKYFGGTHDLPNIVNNMNEQPAGDLLEHVDLARTSLIDAMKQYGKP